MDGEKPYQVRDAGKTFSRGGKEYRRPIGWYRFALKVLGRYGDNQWLGSSGYREHSDAGEWAVSYHGTSRHNGLSIADEGFQLSKCTRFAYGKGIYSTPSLRIAMQYAPHFEFQGKTFCIIIQNRVNVNNAKVVKVGAGSQDEYWIAPDQTEIRAYGILVREVVKDTNNNTNITPVATLMKALQDQPSPPPPPRTTTTTTASTTTPTTTASAATATPSFTTNTTTSSSAATNNANEQGKKRKFKFWPFNF